MSNYNRFTCPAQNNIDGPLTRAFILGAGKPKGTHGIPYPIIDYNNDYLVNAQQTEISKWFPGININIMIGYNWKQLVKKLQLSNAIINEQYESTIIHSILLALLNSQGKNVLIYYGNILIGDYITNFTKNNNVILIYDSDDKQNMGVNLDRQEEYAEHFNYTSTKKFAGVWYIHNSQVPNIIKKILNYNYDNKVISDLFNLLIDSVQIKVIQINKPKVLL